MINNVGNFAVGPNEITSASCEGESKIFQHTKQTSVSLHVHSQLIQSEAHCEVGQFVPCSGATRRRMNIGKICSCHLMFLNVPLLSNVNLCHHLWCSEFNFKTG